jgi:hypothetical protein
MTIIDSSTSATIRCYSTNNSSIHTTSNEQNYEMLDFNGLELRSEKIANIQKTTRASLSLGCTIENITP